MKKRNEKKENYGKYIKEMYWPKASAKKHLELEKLKDKLYHKSPVLEALRKKGKSNS